MLIRRLAVPDSPVKAAGRRLLVPGEGLASRDRADNGCNGMTLIHEIRTRLRTAAAPLIGLLVVLYFAFHLAQGERGLIAWSQLSQGIETANRILGELEQEREILEHRVRLLRSDSLDPDMLDERVRLMLGFGAGGEFVILDPSQGPAAAPAGPDAGSD